jgi:hypothetical protein
MVTVTKHDPENSKTFQIRLIKTVLAWQKVKHISCQLRQPEQSDKKPKLISWLDMSEEIFGELQSI